MDIILAIITLLINTILGWVVYHRDRSSRQAQFFVLMSFFINVWIITNFLTHHNYGYRVDVNDIANRLAFFAGYSIVVAGLLFTDVFPRVRRVGRCEKVGRLLLIVPILALSLFDEVAGHVRLTTGGQPEFEAGQFLWLYMVGFLGLICLLARNLAGSIGREKGVRQRQSILILIAFCTSALLGLLLNVVLPLVVSSWETTRLGPVVVVLLVSMVAYSIIRHGLFDIRLAVMRSTAYGLSLVTLAAIYYFLAYIVSVAVLRDEANLEASASPINITLALLLAFIFQPIKQFFDQVTNNIFYRDRYDTSQFYANLSELLSGTTDLRRLLQKASVKIGTTLKAESAFFFVRLGDKLQMTAGEGKYRKLPPQDITVVIDYVARHGDDIIVTEQLGKDSHQLRRLLVSHKIALLLPLVHGNAALGFFALGDQRGRGYDGRDIRTLTTVADELIIAINHALVVQEIKEINEHLEQRIDAATRELRSKNLRLQRLDATKDEFLSMASHQLRTPLTSIKGYLSMVLEGDAGKVPAKQRQLLEEAFNGSGRMVRLIHDFLNISRLQTGKFALEYHRSDIVKIVNDEVRLLASPAKSRHIRLRIHSGIPTAELYIDENKVRQVVMNLIDNALYYSHEKSTVDIRLHRSATHIEFSVSDTGIGVPTDEQDALFTKFYRASNARQQRPDGTGIGLFLAKKVITAHGGEVTYVPHKRGSTFGFKLPLSLADKHSH